MELLRDTTLLRLLVLLGCATMVACSTGFGRISDEPMPAGQLPRDVAPLAYDISLRIDPDASRLTGQVGIDIQLTRPRDVIWLHGRDLDVSSATLHTADGRRIELAYQQVSVDGLVKLELGEFVGPQMARLEFVYSAAFSKGLEGAYRVEVDGAHYIFTQFQAIAARSVFPGWDEPFFKAAYNLVLTVPGSDTAVANTPVIETTLLPDGFKQLKFRRSEALPSYLLAFAVGPLSFLDLEALPSTDVRPTKLPLRGVAVDGRADGMDFAMQHTRRILEFQERYFGSAYPFDKLDQIAVPDFAPAAMENAGLIAYRSGLLFIDPVTSSEDLISYALGTQAHELAHQWFGDLVTPAWWDDLWLNESFATWFENKTLEALYPEFEPQLSRVHTSRSAMTADRLMSARQVRNKVSNTDDIQNAFDGITYAKGAAVLGMFEKHVGEAAWRRGVQRYLQQHRFDVADLDDFMAAVQAEAGVPVSEPMKSFLFQPGLPLLKVDLACSGDQADVVVEQSRYLPLGSTGNPAALSWQVPFCFAYEDGGEIKEQCQLLTEQREAFPLAATACPAWLHPNPGWHGYYQWRVEKPAYDALAEAGLDLPSTLSLNFSVRSGFYDGSLSAAEALAIGEKWARSPIPAIAREAMIVQQIVQRYILPDELLPASRRYASMLYDKTQLLDSLRRGGATDSDRADYEAQLLHYLYFRARDEEVQRELAAIGRTLLPAGASSLQLGRLPAAYNKVVLDAALAEFGEPFFHQLVEVMRTATAPNDRNLARRVLLGVRQPELADWLLDEVLEGDLFRKAEIDNVVRAQIQERSREGLAWDWLKKHYGTLSEALPSSTFGGTPFISMTRTFCSEDMAADVAAFFGPVAAERQGGQRNLSLALEQIRLCAARSEFHRESATAYIRQWAAENPPNGPETRP
ncbi:MAG: M1 family metallopeptidase [Gammaproteobacteria bacterium]|nr:M1 family metallopeptidase [Gammaproteobacteria bacterium]